MGKALRELGERLVLTPPEAPTERRRTIFTADAAVRDAMEAALASKFDALDRLEVTYLNVLVRIGELTVRDETGAPWWPFDPSSAHYWRIEQHGLAPFVIEYHRRWGRACAPALEWCVRPACRRCVARLRRVECRVCGGDWHVGETSAPEREVFTDVHGVILPAEEQPA